MTLKEAQTIAERLVNFQGVSVSLDEIRQALVVLSNFYEDYKRYAKELE